MPRFTAHLTAPDGEFQRVVIVSDSEEQARESLMRREYARCAAFLQPHDLEGLAKAAGMSDEEFAKVLPKLLDPKVPLLETLAKSGIRLGAGDRFKLRFARQKEPYKIEWIVEGRNPGRTKGWKRPKAKA